MGQLVVRRILGVGALLGLCVDGPIACLNEEDPRPFSTGDSCYPGDIRDCACADGGLGAVGTQSCPKSRKFDDSPCVCDTPGGNTK